jgi:hypothetical protein
MRLHSDEAPASGPFVSREASCSAAPIGFACRCLS